MARISTTSNTLTSPVWAADFLSREHLVPGGARLDAAQFYNTDAVLVTVGSSASAGATSITVTALTGAIPSGTVLDFGGAKFARLTANAAAAATTLTVAALPTALAGAETARYLGVGYDTVRRARCWAARSASATRVRASVRGPRATRKCTCSRSTSPTCP